MLTVKMASSAVRDNRHHKIINLNSLNDKTSQLSYPKLESDARKKYLEHNDVNSNFNIVVRTQKYVDTLIFDCNSSLQHIEQVICDNVVKEQLNISEVYTVLASYSLWECIEFLLQTYNVREVSNNHHKNNVLHKILVPMWLWNYDNPTKKLPEQLTRTQDDIVKTLQCFINNNLLPPVLEPTQYNSKCINNPIETSITLITLTVPREILGDAYKKLYNMLVCHPTNFMLNKEMNFIMPQIKEDLSQTKYPDKLKNEVMWLVNENSKLFATKFIESCDLTRRDNVIGRLMTMLDLLCDNPTHDGQFDSYFDKPFVQTTIITFMKELLNKIENINKSKNIGGIITNAIMTTFFNFNKKKRLGIEKEPELYDYIKKHILKRSENSLRSKLVETSNVLTNKCVV